MSEQVNYHTPQAVAKQLGVSPATLRRWSDEFAEYLSSGADSGKGKSHRRYTEFDLGTLNTIKELMNSGATYEQVRQQLANQPVNYPFRPQGSMLNSEETLPEQPLDLPDRVSHASDETALVTANGPESHTITFVTNTLIALSESHKSILNSQAANRELMGVLIQDNFNLKEENNRLRERVLELERHAAQVRRDEEWRREALRQEMDHKITAIHQVATQALSAAQAVKMPEIKAVNTKPGCLGAIFGAGATQIIAMPRRRTREVQDGTPPQSPITPTTPPQPSLPQQRSAAHPKPSAPPE
jgi:DNA-binding transcriptional MerR regulator